MPPGAFAGDGLPMNHESRYSRPSGFVRAPHRKGRGWKADQLCGNDPIRSHKSQLVRL